MCWWMCIYVNKADKWGSEAIQTCPLHGHVTALKSQGYRWALNPESEFCEVIGQILLHGVTVVLHWLIRDALAGEDSHRE